MDLTGVGARLNVVLQEAGLEPLDSQSARRFGIYYSLFIRWNERLNLSAIRDEQGILSVHFLESIAVARCLPNGITCLLDFGSGAGLPGVPIAICRPEIEVTLAESQGKKAAFLEELLRVLGLNANVHAGRAETLGAVFDCVILRAVDRMPKSVEAAVNLVSPNGWLTLMTTAAEFERLKDAAGPQFHWAEPKRLPNSDSRILALGRRINSRA